MSFPGDPSDRTLDVLDPRDPSPTAQEALDLWLRVQRCLALRPAEAIAHLVRDPDPRPLAELRCGLASSPGDLRHAKRALAGNGTRIVPYPSPAYPGRLRALSDAAPALAVRGDPQALARPCVAIVGSRAATAYGKEMARRLAAGLAQAGVVVVSGLARGIDAAAHEAALAAGGLTVAFQACGPDRVYPAAHRGLAERIAGQGAVVSELPVGTPPRKAHFPLRNRLISGVSRAVIVVEARLPSGSLVTARHALDQGIEVLAVPGPVTAPTSGGTNALLRDGAAPALEAGDVLAAIGVEVEATPPKASTPSSGAPVEPETAAALRLIAEIRREPGTRDELARRLGLSPGGLAVELLPLELDGRVVEDRTGRLCVTQGGPGRGLSSGP